MLKYCIVKQKGSRRVIYVSHTRTCPHTSPAEVPSPMTNLSGGITSFFIRTLCRRKWRGHPFCTVVCFRAKERRTGRRVISRETEGDADEGKRDQEEMCLCEGEKKSVCMNKKWRLLKAGWEGGNVICVCACICVQSTENGSHIGSQIKRLMGWISIK